MTRPAPRQVGWLGSFLDRLDLAWEAAMFASGVFGRSFIDGERGWIRTSDPRLKRALLYQLSYAPTLLQSNTLQSTTTVTAHLQKTPILPFTSARLTIPDNRQYALLQ
jgi:hypothetical protein